MLQFESLSADRNGNPFQYFPGESHGQRSLAGYSPWGRSRTHSGFAVGLTVLGEHLSLVSSFLPEFLPASVSCVACLISAGGLVPQPATSVYCRNLPSPLPGQDFCSDRLGMTHLYCTQIGSIVTNLNWEKIKPSGLEVSSVPFGFNTYLWRH